MHMIMSTNFKNADIKSDKQHMACKQFLHFVFLPNKNNTRLKYLT